MIYHLSVFVLVLSSVLAANDSSKRGLRSVYMVVRNYGDDEPTKNATDAKPQNRMLIKKSKNKVSKSSEDDESAENDGKCACGVGKPALARKISEIGKNDDDDDDDKRGEKNKMGFGGAKKRIVNGYQPEHSRPWMAVLEVTKDGGQCGGSVVTRKYVLTAAHCFCFDNKDYADLCKKEDNDSGSLKDKIKVYLGTKNLKKDKGKVFRAAALHLHPKRVKLELDHRKTAKADDDYVPYAGPYDIALVKLDRSIKFTENEIMPICLFEAKYRDFTYGYVAGFGSDNFATSCWTNKDGPNPFEQCKHSFEHKSKKYRDKCVTDHKPEQEEPDCRELFESKDFKYSKSGENKKIYVRSGKLKERKPCYYPDEIGEYGWCKIAEADDSGEVDWGICSSHCYEHEDHLSKASIPLKETRLSLMEKGDCEKLGRSMEVETGIEFCAALKHNDTVGYDVYERAEDGDFRKVDDGEEELEYFGGSDACQGDSGGPIWVWAYKSNKEMKDLSRDERDRMEVRAHQIGIVSRGNGCAYKNQPGAYTAIEEFKDFVTDKIKDDSCVKK